MRGILALKHVVRRTQTPNHLLHNATKYILNSKITNKLIIRQNNMYLQERSINDKEKTLSSKHCQYLSKIYFSRVFCLVYCG